MNRPCAGCSQATLDEEIPHPREASLLSGKARWNGPAPRTWLRKYRSGWSSVSPCCLSRPMKRYPVTGSSSSTPASYLPLSGCGLLHATRRSVSVGLGMRNSFRMNRTAPIVTSRRCNTPSFAPPESDPRGTRQRTQCAQPGGQHPHPCQPPPHLAPIAQYLFLRIL